MNQVTQTTDTAELTAFVAGTLKAIAAGIEEAQVGQLYAGMDLAKFY